MVSPYLNYDATMAEIAERRRQFDRMHDEYRMPKYRDIERPESYGGLTGMLPEDYWGPYGGMPTFGALSGAASLFGQVGGGVGSGVNAQLDARLAEMGYAPGQRTLAGRELDMRGDIARRQMYEWDREFGASRSDADRAFGEMQRQSVNADRARDTALELETGIPYFNGSPMPEWLRPHAEWARQYATGNQGRMPTFEELTAALGKHGHQPEDFNAQNPGQPFAGTLPTVGPGIIYDPARGGNYDTISGKVIDGPELAAELRNRMSGGVRASGFDEAGRPIYAAAQGDQLSSQAGLGPGGMQMMPGRMEMQSRADAVSGQARGTGTGSLASQKAGTATRTAFASGTPRSQAQRELEERGRQFDASNEIDRMRAEAEVARMNGQEARADELERRAMSLREEIDRRGAAVEEGRLGLEGELGRGRLGLDTELGRGRLTLDRDRLGFDKGVAVGMVDGQETLDRGALLGTFNGMSTLAGQQAYGGSALVGGGLTLDAQRAIGRVGGQETLDSQALRGYTPQGATLAREGQEADTALRALQLESTLRADPFKLAVMREGLSATGIPNAIEAVAGRRQLPGVQGPQARPMAPGLGEAVGALTGPTFGRTMMQRPAMDQQAPMGGRPNGPPQILAGGPMQGGPTFGRPMASAQQQLRALPSLNQVNSREYMKMGPGGQRFVNSAFKAAGMAQEDDEIQDAVRKGLPGQGRAWRTPTFGRVA
ncbi:MAG TPA: hypothetical protein VD926_14230 [Acidimicrobiales bacterium]|nr:hypothetical protein [Acidimicrobiales bacterium]